MGSFGWMVGGPYTLLLLSVAARTDIQTNTTGISPVRNDINANQAVRVRGQFGRLMSFQRPSEQGRGLGGENGRTVGAEPVKKACSALTQRSILKVKFREKSRFANPCTDKICVDRVCFYCFVFI